MTLLLCLAIGPYLNAVANDLVYDDRALVAESEQVRSLDPPTQFRAGLGRYAVEWYRPLTMYSLAVNYRLHGVRPAGYHIVNLMLHATAVALVYGIAVRLLQRPGPALVAAGLFAVLPIHVEAVTPVSGRSDLLATALVLLVWWLALGAERQTQWGRAATVGTVSFAALLAKESAIVVWPLIAIAELSGLGLAVFSNSTPRGRLQEHWRIHAALAVALIAYVWLRTSMTGSSGASMNPIIRPLENPMVNAAVGVRFATANWVLARYCSLLMFPAGLSADYSFNQIPLVTSWNDPRLTAGAALVAALCAAAAATWPRRRAISALVLSFLVLWLPVSSIIVPIGTIMGERLMYLPSVAVVLLVGASIATIRDDARGLGTIFTAMLTTAVVVQVGLIVARNRVWRSQEALFADTVSRSPSSAKAHFNYGTALVETGDGQRAAEEFRRAVQIAPEYPEAHNGLGTILLSMRNLSEAETEFRAALREKSDLANAWVNLGVTLARAGRDGEAASALSASIRLNPNLPLAHANLGVIAERRGDRDLAIDEYLKTYRLHSTLEGLAPHLVELLAAAGRQAEANAIARDFRRANGSR